MSMKQYEMLVTCKPWIATNLKYTNPYLNYHPELDITPTLDADDTNLYQSYTSILRWIVELRQLDICVHVAWQTQGLVIWKQFITYLVILNIMTDLVCYFVTFYPYFSMHSFLSKSIFLFSSGITRKNITRTYMTKICNFISIVCLILSSLFCYSGLHSVSSILDYFSFSK